MPELPEVETVVRELRRLDLCNVLIHKADCFSSHLKKNEFSLLAGRKIHRIFRRGKYIVMDMEGGFLVWHLRMTGQILHEKPEELRHVHFFMEFGNGKKLWFRDQRKFGTLEFIQSLDKVEKKLGPEPFSENFNVQWVQEFVKNSKRPLKSLLLDQSFVAGIGNIYADETLFEAALHPQKASGSLDSVQIAKLIVSVKKILKMAIENMGTSLGGHESNFYSVSGRRGRNQDRLMVFRRNGESCFSCFGKIERIRIAGRSTHFCPVCQKGI